MEEQFIPYELALELEELGFDEECFGYYNMINHSGKFKFDIRIWENSDDYIEAPLWQQAFDFFRKKYKLSSHCDLKSVNHLGENYYYKIINFADFIDDSTIIEKDGFNSIEEARLECLKKIIEIVKVWKKH